MNCIVCGKELINNQTKYCSSKCKKNNLNHNDVCYQHQKDRGLKRKLYFIRKLGGKCSMCGYDKNISCLVFHHLKDKLLMLDSRSMSSNDIGLVKLEVEKCILLCHNCHSELHHPDSETIKLNEQYPEISEEQICIKQSRKKERHCKICGIQIEQGLTKCSLCNLKNKKKRTINKMNPEIIIEMYKTKTISEISRETGFGRRRISHMLKKFGFETCLSKRNNLVDQEGFEPTTCRL